jgi:hypothetical protein
MEDMTMHRKLWQENLNRRDNSEDVDINRKIIGVSVRHKPRLKLESV